MEALSIDLPEELLIDLLSRLPRKTLARFKCLSRNMCHLISNAVPITTIPKVLIRSYPQKKSLSFQLVDNKSCIERVFKPMDENIVRHRKVKVRSSCHGLLLIEIDKALFVWNPLTYFFRKVLTLEYRLARDSVASLCYCSTIAKYKVVLKKSWSDFSRSQYFYVATFGDTSWENIQVLDLDNVSEGPFLKGYRYWLDQCDSLAYCRSIHPQACILSFDPNTNKFTKVASPQPKKDNISDTFLGIGVIDECLCITRPDDPRNYRSNIEFLVMKEYGNDISWEILFVISNTPGFAGYDWVEPIFRTKEGEILIITKIHHTITMIKCYDDNGNFLRCLLIAAYDESSKPVSYEESWFSPTV